MTSDPTIRRAIGWFAVLLVSAGTPAAGQSAPPDALAIMRRAIEIQKQRPQWFVVANTGFLSTEMRFVYESRVTIEEFDADGEMKSSTSARYESVPIEGVRYTRILELDGLPVAEENDEELEASLERLREYRERVAGSSPEDLDEWREAYETEVAEALEERSKILDEALRAFTYAFDGEALIGGRPALVLRATPRADYEPDGEVPGSEFLPKFDFRIWIDAEDGAMVRFHARLNEDVDFGPFGLLGRVADGSWYRIEMSKADDGAWLPAEVLTGISWSALFRRKSQRFGVSFTHYRDFETSVTLGLPIPTD